MALVVLAAGDGPRRTGDLVPFPRNSPARTHSNQTGADGLERPSHRLGARPRSSAPGAVLVHHAVQRRRRPLRHRCVRLDLAGQAERLDCGSPLALWIFARRMEKWQRTAAVQKLRLDACPTASAAPPSSAGGAAGRRIALVWLWPDRSVRSFALLPAHPGPR